MTLSGGAFGLVFGLAARTAGFSALEAIAMSVFVSAGASQFAAVGLVAQGVGTPAIVLLTALLNARHLLYSAALAPWFAGRRTRGRAAAAHVITDETFALSSAHFLRIHAFDARGYWMAAGFVVVPFIVASAIAAAGAQAIPDPRALGLDIVFPAAMAGLLVGLLVGRSALTAAASAAVIAVLASLVAGTAVGVVAAGVIGPAVGLIVGDRAS
jgi:predicted branched-subunit amino acid permease